MSELDSQTLQQLTTLNKRTSKTYNDQKAMIKKVMQGRIINCQKCKQPLHLDAPTKVNDSRGKLACKNGCTDIELDMV